MRGRGEQPKQDRKRANTPASDWIRVPVPPIVDPAVFDAVQEQLRENGRRSRERAHGASYLLQGLLVCRSCGYSFCGICGKTRLSGGVRRTYTYYRCCGINVRRSKGRRICTNTPLRTDLLDAAVWQEVGEVLRDPARIAAEYERRLEMARRGNADDLNLAAVQTQLSKLRRGMGRLIDSYAEGLIERAKFEPRIAGLRQKVRAWEAQAKALQDEAAQRHTLSLILGRLEDFARRVHDRMSDLDWHQRRELVRFLVKRVEIDHEQINVVLRVNPPPSGSDPSGNGTRLQNCSRRERADAARPPPPVHRRARPHGMAEGLRLQHARSRRGSHGALETGDRRRAALAHG